MLNRRPEGVDLARALGLRDRAPRDGRVADLDPRRAAAAAPVADGRAARPRRSSAGSGILSRRGPRPGRQPSRSRARRRSSTATSRSATWSPSGSATRWSTGWSSRCSVACTPATRGELSARADACRSWSSSPGGARSSSRRPRSRRPTTRPVFAGHPRRHGPARRRAGRVRPVRGPDRRAGPGAAPAHRPGLRADRRPGDGARDGAWPTRSCWPPRPRRPPGCSADLAPGRRRRSWPAIESASMAVVTFAFRAARRAGPAGLGLPGAARSTGGRIKASTFSFAKWDWVRDAGRARGGRARTCCSCAPPSAGTARRRRSRCPTRSWWRCPWPSWPTRSGSRADAGRRPRAALGRRPAAVRRRPPRPGRPDPRRRGRRARARGVRCGVRRGRHPGRDRLGPAAPSCAPGR